MPTAPHLGKVREPRILSGILCHGHREDQNEKLSGSFKHTSTAGRRAELHAQKCIVREPKQPVLLGFLPHGISFVRSLIKSGAATLRAPLVQSTLQKLEREPGGGWPHQLVLFLLRRGGSLGGEAQAPTQLWPLLNH